MRALFRRGVHPAAVLPLRAHGLNPAAAAHLQLHVCRLLDLSVILIVPTLQDDIDLFVSYLTAEVELLVRTYALRSEFQKARAACLP